MNVVILAGGRGTRLAGVWNTAKCLVPVGGIPIITRLLWLVADLPIRQSITLALGYQAEEVRRYILDSVQWEKFRPILFRIDDQTQGTAGAFREAIDGRTGPTLVLNGDTLPKYDLRSLISFHQTRVYCWATAAFVHDALRWKDTYAGAAVLSAEAVEAAKQDTRMHDFQGYILGANRYYVPGFLDVGTPENFKLAQEYQP